MPRKVLKEMGNLHFLIFIIFIHPNWLLLSRKIIFCFIFHFRVTRASLPLTLWRHTIFKSLWLSYGVVADTHTLDLRRLVECLLSWSADEIMQWNRAIAHAEEGRKGDRNHQGGKRDRMVQPPRDKHTGRKRPQQTREKGKYVDRERINISTSTVAEPRAISNPSLPS